MYSVRVFDQLIFNTDRNLGNLVIDKTWQMWMIHEVARLSYEPQSADAKELTKCDSALLQRMRELNEPLLKKELGRYLTSMEIQGLLSRRDKIVKVFEQKGPAALYTSAPPPD